MSFFVPFLVGLGFHELFQGSSWRSVTRITGALLVVIASVAAPIAAADDMYRLPQMSKQVEFDAGEYHQLEETAEFVNDYEVDVTAPWLGETVMYRFEAPAKTPKRITERGFKIRDGGLLYREKWTRHRVIFTDYLSIFSDFWMSERYYEDLLTAQNKVYTAGEVGYLWCGRPATLDTTVGCS
jgi:hypothetical protein